MNLSEVKTVILNVKTMLQELIDENIITYEMAEKIAPVILENILKYNSIIDV